MYYKNILLFIMIILGVVLALSLKQPQTQEPKIIYRYIPRSDDNYIDTAKPAFVSRIFSTMFDKPSPWILSLKNPDYTTLQNVNDFYVSQA